MKKQRNKNPIQPVIGTKVPRYAGPNTFAITSKKQGNEIILSAIKKDGTLSMKAKAVY